MTPTSQKSQTVNIRELPVSDKSKGYKKQFYRDWKAYNLAKFNNRLSVPNDLIILASEIGDRDIKLADNLDADPLGYWSPSDSVMALHYRLFANPMAYDEVLLHEMCHQAISELDGVEAIKKDVEHAKTQGHGELWTNWMLKVGLPPSRFFTASLRGIATEKEHLSLSRSSPHARKAKLLGFDNFKLVPFNQLLSKVQGHDDDTRIPVALFNERDKICLGYIIDSKRDNRETVTIAFFNEQTKQLYVEAVSLIEKQVFSVPKDKLKLMNDNKRFVRFLGRQ